MTNEIEEETQKIAAIKARLASKEASLCVLHKVVEKSARAILLLKELLERIELDSRPAS